MTVLASYIGGQWRAPSGEGAPLHDAVTGEEVARISSDGHRPGGRPRLRPRRRRPGAARADLPPARGPAQGARRRTCASTGRSSTPLSARDRRDPERLEDRHRRRHRRAVQPTRPRAAASCRTTPCYVDGAVEPLGKGGTFVGQHICTPLPGVAVQINAFNFPVWGMLEKLAPAFLAGRADVVKPASQTAYLTAGWSRLIVESGLLPEGSLQLICGSAGDLLDHLTEQDLVSFTGSASTAAAAARAPGGRRQRACGSPPRPTRSTARSSARTPRRAPPEFDLFVKQLVTEMTVKAGQKCTAIRRAFVPGRPARRGRRGASRPAGGGHRRRPGEPGAYGWARWPACEQREEVRRGAQGAADARPRSSTATPSRSTVRRRRRRARRVHVARSCCASTTRRGRSRTRSRPSARSSTVMPTPRPREAVDARRPRAGQPRRLGRHRRPGRSPARSCSASRRGTAACWCSTATTRRSPPATARRCRPSCTAAPAAPAAARSSAASAACCTTCSAPPCRAAPDMLTAITGRWVAGRARARRRTCTRSASRWPSCASATRVVAGPRTVTLEDIEHFADFTGDTFYAHTDEEAAAANPFFGGSVAHGYLIVSLAAGLFVDPEPGPVLANYGLENLRFLTPV